MRHRLADPPASTPRSGRAAARSLAVVAVGLGVLGLAGPAVAHDALIGSDPAQDAVLTQAPTQVVLTFAADQAGVGSEVLVTDAAGQVWSDGPAQVVAATVTQPLLPDLPNGAYTVTWRSVAGDGHPVTGAFGFSVAAPLEEPTEQATEPTEQATGTAEPAEPTAATEPPATEAPSGTAAASSVADDGETPAAWVWWAAAVVALVVLGALLVRRRGAHD